MLSKVSCFLLKSFHSGMLQRRQVFSPYKSLYFECYATTPMLADAHISSLGYLWFITQNNKLFLLSKTFDCASISLRLGKTIFLKILLLMTAMNDLLYLKWLSGICHPFGQKMPDKTFLIRAAQFFVSANENLLIANFIRLLSSARPIANHQRQHLIVENDSLVH